MTRFRLTLPALLTVVCDGRSITRISPWGGGALAQDLLLGHDALLDHIEQLQDAAPEHRFGVRASATIDVDARRLRLFGDPGGIDGIPPLRRAYVRALSQAWPRWDVAERLPPPPSNPWVSMIMPRRLPPPGPTRAVLTHVSADGAVRDVGVPLPVEEALSLGPPLREALARHPTFALGPEARLDGGTIVTPCTSGALIDDHRGTVEVWWSEPTPTRWATIGPLGRLWPDHVVTAHDRGLPHQVGASGRAPATVELDDDRIRALLHHRLFAERWFDPVDLRRRVLASLRTLEEAGVPVDVPEYVRPGPRPAGIHPLRDAAEPPPGDAPTLPPWTSALLHLESAIQQVDRALRQDIEPPSRASARLHGPPVWCALAFDEVTRQLNPEGVARLARWLAPRCRVESLSGASDGLTDHQVAERLREALYTRAREAPGFEGSF